jgi:threonine dehydrogenase-like Zn-dependent dehydrogenase
VAIDPNNVCGACPSCLSGKAHFCLRMVGTGTTSDGGFAEYCLVHRRQLNRIGDELSFEEGAMAEPVSCCLHGLDLTEVRPGDDVLIIGGGTIGQIMVRLCALSGAARIALLEPVEQKRALALRSGACMAENPFDEGYETKLLSAFPGKFNKVIECVGSKATMENAVRFAGNASVVLLFGLTAPDCAMEIRPYDLFRNEITLKASYINPYTIARAVALLNSGRLQVRDLISDVIALEDCVKVFTDASYRTRGKIIIRP